MSMGVVRRDLVSLVGGPLASKRVPRCADFVYVWREAAKLCFRVFDPDSPPRNIHCITETRPGHKYLGVYVERVAKTGNLRWTPWVDDDE